VDWVHLAQKRDVLCSYERGPEPSGTIKGGEFIE
jgi:hypothetical protein